MKKVLLVVVMLLLVSQVMATTTISAIKSGSLSTVDGMRIQAVSITYNSDDNDIRAFALDININHGSMKNIRDFNVGESNGAVTGGKSGYGIFPSRFRDFIVPTAPAWGDANANSNYNPTPAWNEPGTSGTGMGYNKFTVEMGTLYAGDPNKPARSGTLFTFDVNDENDCNGITLAVAANTLRGSIVDSASNAVGNAVFNGLSVMGSGCVTTCTISGQVVGAAAPKTGGIGGMKLYLNSVDTGVLTNGTGNFTLTVNAPYTGTLTCVDANNQWSWSPANRTFSAITTNQTGQNFTGTATECMNKLDTKYTRWVSYNKPDCWCYQKQCKGDADGVKTLGKPVASPDLTIFKAAVGQTAAYVKTSTCGGKPCICADFDRGDTLGKPVASPDLTIFKSNVGVADTSVPQCTTIVNAWKN